MDTTVKHVIDCNADRPVSRVRRVEEHKKGGQLEWDFTKVALYLSENQKDGKVIKGDKLRRKLKGKPVLNANVLDFLLANPELIPDEWKGKEVFFWGTIYRRLDGSSGCYYRCVCFLCWGVRRSMELGRPLACLGLGRQPPCRPTRNRLLEQVLWSLRPSPCAKRRNTGELMQGVFIIFR